MKMCKIRNGVAANHCNGSSDSIPVGRAGGRCRRNRTGGRLDRSE